MQKKWTMKEIKRELRAELVRTMAGADGLRGKALQAAVDHARDSEPPILLRVDRRVRYFVDGAVIGSKRYIRKVAAEHEELAERLAKGKLQSALLPNGQSVLVYRRLNNIRD